jgi:hypothetical protein
VADGVEVLGVDKEAVHVKETCSNWWETGGVRLEDGGGRGITLCVELVLS